jgi:ribosomal protein S18 acetylase RimI-like enzyme
VHLAVVDPESPSARHCLERYFAELADRFEGGFDPARSIGARAPDLRQPHGLFLVATLHGRPVGCGALKLQASYGEIKRMWVDPACRGLGVGKRILGRLEELTRERGLGVVRLETNRALSEAQSLYRRYGYREVAPYNDEPYAHHWFEKVLSAEPAG